MTTMAQLDKYAAKWFNDQMRRRGFAVEKKFIFWRKRGPLYDMFLSEILTGGELLRISVTIWSPWAKHPDGEFDEFPPSYALIGGYLSDRFPEDMLGGCGGYFIENEETMEKTLRDVLNLIDKHALPWFPTINSYDSYAAYIGDHGFYPTPEFQEKLKKGIARGFECEPFI